VKESMSIAGERFHEQSSCDLTWSNWWFLTAQLIVIWLITSVHLFAQA